MGEYDNELGVKGERKKAQGSKIRIERKLRDPNMSPPTSPSSPRLLFPEFVLLLAGKTLRRHPEPVFNKGGHLILGPDEGRQPRPLSPKEAADSSTVEKPADVSKSSAVWVKTATF